MRCWAFILLIGMALVLSGRGTPAEAQVTSRDAPYAAQYAPNCAAYPPGSAGAAACWRYVNQSQSNSSYWEDMDRRASQEFHAGY